ncbi:hypothetical protein [Kitasatospora sp. LaBMicrA B282]|uniref:hypothetical protein n=1 Tax=Kitasatospora sp. LaBMicrA B282 TaxID=3420949 RepID=UPI003D11491B
MAGSDAGSDAGSEPGSEAGSAWIDHVRGAHQLTELFHGAPALPALDFTGVLVDERADSGVTLGFDAIDPPGAATSPLFADGRNALEFFLVFAGVRDLAVTGWDHLGLRSCTIDPLDPRTPFDPVDPGTLRVALAGEGWRIDFLADSCRVEGLRSYRAAPEFG